ncbi:MAG TPA: hypothetical protein VMW70_00780 [Burkholderiales bacterium]|nr:hypothetical protein [Burkholderiales bacterium]
MKLVTAVSVVLFGIAFNANAASEKDERGGTCEDAKSQYRYFCDREGFKDDIMLNAPIACSNARRNMAAACDGLSEEDTAYEFHEGTPAE